MEISDLIYEASLFFVDKIEYRIRHGRVYDCYGARLATLDEMLREVDEGRWPVVRPDEITDVPEVSL
jgi:hypothetical protein